MGGTGRREGGERDDRKGVRSRDSTRVSSGSPVMERIRDYPDTVPVPVCHDVSCHADFSIVA
jgi:hypothetical protein